MQAWRSLGGLHREWTENPLVVGVNKLPPHAPLQVGCWWLLIVCPTMPVLIASASSRPRASPGDLSYGKSRHRP